MVRFSLIPPLPFLNLYHSHCRQILASKHSAICALCERVWNLRTAGAETLYRLCHEASFCQFAIEDFATAWKVWLWQKTRNCLTTTKRMWLILRLWTCTAREVQMPITHRKTRTLAVQTVLAGAPDLTSTDACIGMGWCEDWKQWCL